MSPRVILTASGRYFDIQNPGQSPIDIYDIGRALSRICRFTGHTAAFYSVAQHSVLVSKLVPEHLALEGLLHDASEAYLGDVSPPLKGLLPDYRRIEQEVQWAIAGQFCLEFPFHEDIHYADMMALATERRDLMPAAKAGLQEMDRDQWAYVNSYGCAAERIIPLPADYALDQFIKRYEEIIMSGVYRESSLALY